MLYLGYLIKVEIILVVQQETPSLYLWQSGNSFVKQFIPFFFNHSFIKCLRHPQSTSVKRFVPYLVKLPMPLVLLLKVSVPALHLPKFNE